MGNLIRTFSLAEHEACMAGEVAEPSENPILLNIGF